MTTSMAETRLLSFLEAAAPTVVLAENGADPMDQPDGALLVTIADGAPAAGGSPVTPAPGSSTEHLLDAEPSSAGPGAVVARLPLGSARGSEVVTLTVVGAGLEPDAQAVLAEIARADSDDAPTRPLDETSGAVLWCLARARRAERVLEVGTGAGAATVWLGSAVAGRGGTVTSLERDSAMRTLARRNLRRAGLTDAVDLRLGVAERLLPRLSGPFDLVLLDHDPSDRPDDLLAVLPACAPDALVVSPGARRDSAGLALYNATVASHPAVKRTIYLATPAGLTLSLLR
ncbi:MAG: O-methyltransferase [Anaerolineae bacterium]